MANLSSKEEEEEERTIHFVHNHRINVAEAFSYLRMSVETRKTFLKYFEDGLSPSEAKSFHKSCLVTATPVDKICELLANAHVNPLDRTIYHLYETWRKENYGTRELKRVILREYHQPGTIVYYWDKSFSDIKTPYMIPQFAENVKSKTFRSNGMSLVHTYYPKCRKREFNTQAKMEEPLRDQLNGMEPHVGGEYMRTQALEEILKDVRTVKPEVSILEIKNKFNALKTNFMMEQQKMQNSQRSGGGDEDIYVPSLWYFENLLFVLEHATPRASYDSIIVNEEVCETVASQDAEMELLLIDEDCIDEATAALVTPPSSNATPTPTSYGAQATSTAGAKQKKRNSDAEHSAYFKDASDAMKVLTGSIT
ncbi:hypothetical protein FQA39_LY13115 [Lamprigera yunnana]|nr:hypothetical protein FQA39_LY13115 [Lamprigera yunnana]